MTTKPRVYGEQIKVRFCDNNIVKPLIIDFDSMETRLLVTQEESYRTIGKSVSTHTVNYEGFEITLTRNKRDPYLDSLILHLSNMAKNRRGYSEFAIYKIVTHTYSESSINLEKEFDDTMSQDALIAASFIKSALQGAITQFNAAASNMLKKVPFGKTAFDVVNNIKNFGNFLNSFALQPFKEATVYYDCVVTNFNTSDKPHEASEQTITLKSTFAKRFQDNNTYDKYIAKVITENYLSKLAKDIEAYKERMDLVENTKIFNDNTKIADVNKFFEGNGLTTLPSNIVI